MSFMSRLEDRARQVDSLLCVGLDPHLPDLAEPTAQAARDFCLRLIEAAWEFAAAFKPNSAFFEALGAPGFAVLAQVITAVPTSIPVILDAKRGDIASTAQAYARAAFQELGASAVTLSPYLGGDSLEPFLADSEHGVFLLCKTSNPGAADLQDLETGPDGLRLYEQVARLALAWNSRDNLGLVVGATQPEALRRARLIAPGLWILAPGVGAQGGDLRLALAAGLRPDGLGMLVPASRALSRASDPHRAARELRDQINYERAKVTLSPSAAPVRAGPEAWFLRLPAPTPAPPITDLADGLLESGCVKFGRFTLKSGLESPIYLDLRQLASYPRLLEQVAAAYVPILRGLAFDRLAALPYAALPIGTAISLQTGWPLVYPRKEAKSYGTRAEIEGLFAEGERLVVIDDLATTGESKFEAIQKLTSAGLLVSDVVVLIDRQSGAAESLAQAGYRLHAVFTLGQLLDYWEAGGKVSPEHIAAAREFISR